jgi:hypothetical protein
MRYSRAVFLHKSEACGQETSGLAKKLKFRKLESLIKGFLREILMKRTISMRLITKKFQDRPKKKLYEMS